MLTILLISSVLAANPEQTACRSVYLDYPAAHGTAFYNELTPEQSAAGTYFAVCGWGDGYFGIQELGEGKKVVIFSVWEPSKTNRPADVPEDARTQLVTQGEGARIGRFGGEGTGGRCLFDYDWKIGETYRFLVTSKIDGKRTEYAGYFYLPEQQQWKHLVTFSAPNGGKSLGGYYSFVEDFRGRDGSALRVRKGSFGNGWIRTTEGTWQPLAKARFTAVDNAAMNIDGGLVRDRFFLATGGDTTNRDSKLNTMLERPAAPAAQVPQDLP